MTYSTQEWQIFASGQIGWSKWFTPPAVRHYRPRTRLIGKNGPNAFIKTLALSAGMSLARFCSTTGENGELG